MLVKSTRPVNTPGVSDNKGKCVQLVEYLSEELKEERPYYDNFFSQKEDCVTLSGRHASYGQQPQDTETERRQVLYAPPSIPSGEEQQHLIEKSDRGKDR
ncbi:MAG: hypothetical protein ACLUVG_21045 [Phocaeicola vulgatus]